MTASLRQAAQMAYDWMANHGEIVFAVGGMQAIDPMNAAAESLRAALAVPDEPVACKPIAEILVTDDDFNMGLIDPLNCKLPQGLTLLYAAAPVPVERQPLTDAQIDDATCREGILDCLLDPYDVDDTGDEYGSVKYDIRRVARLVETAHGIRGAA